MLLTQVVRTVAAVLIDDFVDHIPGVHPTGIATCHHFDVAAHAFGLGLGGVRFSVAVLEEPLRRLVVPHQGVADDEHVVLFAEGHERIRRGKVVHPRFRMDDFVLHHVLGRDRVEVQRHQRLRASIPARHDIVVDGYAKQERIGVGILERRRGFQGACRHCRTSGSQQPDQQKPCRSSHNLYAFLGNR